MMRNSAIVGWSSLAAVCLSGGPLRGDILVSSRFDTDDEGWRILFRGTYSTPQYIPSGGNPGGYVSGDDGRIGGNRWFWEAPEKFLGELSSTYGGDLGFDLISIPGEQPPPEPAPATQQDVLLARGDTVLSFNHADQPGKAWTEFHVGLEETGWFNEFTGLPATRDDMRFVLAGLESLLLRGDYAGGDQVNGLDNVVITPEPGSLILLALGATVMARRVRRR